MTKKDIKNKLIREVEDMFTLRENQMRKTQGLDKLNAWQEKFERTPDFSKIIIDKLNEILKKNSFEFENENDKNQFTEYIKPTVKDLIVKFIKN